MGGVEVSVVIPSIGRDLAELRRAVDSVRGQTLAPREVIVVMDRDEMSDPGWGLDGVRFVRNRAPHGPAAARNVGVAQARGTHIAWLDDDDVWLPEKLQQQVRAVAGMSEERRSRVIVSSRAILTDGDVQAVGPDRPPRPGENLAEYLFQPPGLRRARRHSIVTPSLLIPRALLLAEPLDQTLTVWEDYEWLLRATDAGAELVFCSQPLVACLGSASREPSQSRTATANLAHQWADEHLRSRSRRAYWSFLLAFAAPGWADEGRWGRACRLIGRGMVDGAPSSAVVKASLVVAAPEGIVERVRRYRRGGREPRRAGAVAECSSGDASAGHRRRVRVGATEVDALSMRQTVAEVVRLVEDEPGVHQHVVVNAAKVVAAQDDPTLADVVNACEIVNADGASVVWASRVLGDPLPERVTGIDLMQELIRVAQQRGWSIYLLGAREHVVQAVAEGLRSRYPGLRIAGARNGYWRAEEDEVVVEAVRASGAQLLFVAMPSPQKELWVARHRQRLGVDLVMGVGGSFDVLAGVTRRAPRWMQRAGLEWLFRLIQEPRRMWKRYLVGNTRFVLLMLRQARRR